MLQYFNEILWIRRASINPVSGTRNPASGYGAPTPTIITKEVIKTVDATQEQLNAAQAAGVTMGKSQEKSRLRTFLGL